MKRVFAHCENTHRTSCDFLGCEKKGMCVDQGIRAMKEANLIHVLGLPTPGVELWLGEEPESYHNTDYDLIVNCNGYWPSYSPSERPSKVPVLMMPFRDTDDTFLLPDKERFEGFIWAVDAMIQNLRPKKVLFHCHAGVNRSAFVLAQYLYTCEGIQDPITLIREKRSKVCLCNSLFVQKLDEWYGLKLEE